MNIVIQSESHDLSTDDVISWIYHLNKTSRISKLDDFTEVNDISLEMSNANKVSVVVNNNVNIDKETKYWYRRGEFDIDKKLTKKSNLNRNLCDETIRPILDYLDSGINQNYLNKFADNSVNKLKLLEKAINLDINIPDTLITSELSQLKEFVTQHKKVITKPIKNPFINFNTTEYKVKFTTHSKLITSDDQADEDYKFLPSFFQKYIEKKIEIRSFYLKGAFYSMAIFSQQNEKTKIDYRNYDRTKPNRCVPFNLPDDLKEKLTVMMEELELNSGSFDIILTPDNEYYFLEVNPIGQFQWLSKNCNYYLEKRIAKSLINE